MSGYGYTLRMGVVANAAADGKSWYGLQLFGTSEKASAPQLEWHPSYGFAARPMPANSDGTGCNALYSLDGQFAWLAHDPRYNDRAPPLSDGASAQWNARGSFALLDYATDTFTLYVLRDGATKASTLVVGQDANGSPYTELRHQNGAYITQTVDSSVMRHTGNAYVEVTSGDINLNGAANCSASFTVGGAAAQSVPLMPQLLSYLQALEILLTAMATTIDAKLVVTAGATVATVTAFISSSAGLKTAMQSQMLKGL